MASIGVVVRWVALAAAAFSLSILLQRNFLLEPSATFAGIAHVYRTVIAIAFGWLEPASAPLLNAIGQWLNVSDLHLALESDLLVQDGFVVLAVFLATLSRGLADGRSGAAVLTVWATLVVLTTAVLRSSAGTLQPLPDEVSTEVSSAYWEFYKVQLVVLAPVIYLTGAAVLSFLRALQVDQRHLVPTIGAVSLTAVPLIVSSRAISDFVLPMAGIDPFASYLGIGAALVPMLFMTILAVVFFALGLARSRGEGDASLAAIAMLMARDLAFIVGAAVVLLAANAGLRVAGL